MPEFPLNIYWLWRPEYSEKEEDGREVKGYSPHDAAQRWAERDDIRSADYTIVGGNPATVMVRDSDGTTIELIVSGETISVYAARLKVPNRYTRQN